MAKTAGFSSSPVVDEVAESQAIPLDALKFVDIELGDLGNELPVGIFLPDGTRLRDFILKPYHGDDEVILGRIIEDASDRSGNLTNPMKVLKQFLPYVVDSIGGLTIKEIAAKFATSVSEIFGRMYLGDVTTIMMKLRLQAHGFEFAMSAECPKCGTVTSDDPAKGRAFHDLSSLVIKTIPNLPQKPVFELVLPESFMLYEDEITRLWLEPLKLNQLDKLLKSTSGNPKDLDQIKEMVVGLPESSVYAKQGGKFFDQAMFAQLATGKDGRVSKSKDAVYKAIAKMQPGPKMDAEMSCSNPMCKNKWTASYPWISFREFLYFGASAPEDS